MMRSLTSVFFLFVLVSVGEAKPKPDFSTAREAILRGWKNGAFPGATVCVGTDEKILWSEAFGYFDYERKKAVSRRTIYDLASVTKVAGTTAVCMRLVGQGKLAVTDPVEKYLPEFITAAGDDAERSWRKQITVEHLLTHTGGMAGWKPFWKDKNIKSYADLLSAVFRTPLERPPGVRFAYSDLGMMMVGEIAARAGGQPLGELEQELVFRPLKMTSTLRNPPPQFWNRIPPTEKWPDQEGFVQGVAHDENARTGEGLTGHAGLFSTAEDLSRLAAELLRALDGRSRLFSREVVAEFFRERETIKNSGRGLGWDIVSDQTAEGEVRQTVAHTGFTGTSIGIDPVRKCYFILLTNRVHPTRSNDKIGRVRRELAAAVERTFAADRKVGRAASSK